MLVRLAGAGRAPGVVEAEPVDLEQAARERIEVRLADQRFLLLVGGRDNQQVPIHDVELVEEQVVRAGESRIDDEIRLGLSERVERR